MQSWHPIAETLGFESEKEMLQHLYIDQGFSINELSTIIGFCTSSVRYRLITHLIPLRPRGGSESKVGKRRLKHVPADELINKSAQVVATKYQVHVSTVYAEKALRKKKGTAHEVLPHYADSSIPTLREEQRPLDGSGSVVASTEVQGVLSEEERSGGGSDS
jgi:hypothetical protein